MDGNWRGWGIGERESQGERERENRERTRKESGRGVRKIKRGLY